MSNRNNYNHLRCESLFHDTISQFYLLGQEYDFYLGLSGSALSLNRKKESDIDMVLILPDNMLSNWGKIFPEFINQKYFQEAVNNKYTQNIDVIGTCNKNNPFLKIEVYKLSVALSILSHKIISINRLKDVYNQNKVEMFINYHGDIINKPLIQTGDLSQTQSFIIKENQIYWGMHFERLFLSNKIVDSLNLSSCLNTSRSIFFETKSETVNLNKLFYLSINNQEINLSNNFRL